MTASEFLREYEGLTPERQKEGVKTFLKTLEGDVWQYEDFIFEILQMACDYEQDDYFGTEGLDI